MVTQLASASTTAPRQAPRLALELQEVPRTWRATDRQVVGLAFAGMAATVTVALGAAIMVQRMPPLGLDRVEVGAWATFFTVFGVIYAIVAGLMVAELLGRFHRLSKVVQDELNAIEDVRDFLIYVDDQQDTKHRIFRTLSAYVASVAHREWRQMCQRRRRVAIDTDTSAELYAVMQAVERIDMRDQSDQVALAAIIGRLAEITTFRTERLHLSGHHLSPAIKALVAFMSAVVIGGFALMAVGSIWVQGFMVVSAAVAVYLLMTVIVDLHHPFDGMWTITRAPFLTVLEHLEQRIAETAAPPPVAAQWGG